MSHIISAPVHPPKKFVSRNLFGENTPKIITQIPSKSDLFLQDSVTSPTSSCFSAVSYSSIASTEPNSPTSQRSNLSASSSCTSSPQKAPRDTSPTQSSFSSPLSISRSIDFDSRSPSPVSLIDNSDSSIPNTDIATNNKQISILDAGYPADLICMTIDYLPPEERPDIAQFFDKECGNKYSNLIIRNSNFSQINLRSLQKESNEVCTKIFYMEEIFKNNEGNLTKEAKDKLKNLISTLMDALYKLHIDSNWCLTDFPTLDYILIDIHSKKPLYDRIIGELKECKIDPTSNREYTMSAIDFRVAYFMHLAAPGYFEQAVFGAIYRGDVVLLNTILNNQYCTPYSIIWGTGRAASAVAGWLQNYDDSIYENYVAKYPKASQILVYIRELIKYAVYKGVELNLKKLREQHDNKDYYIDDPCFKEFKSLFKKFKEALPKIEMICKKWKINTREKGLCPIELEPYGWKQGDENDVLLKIHSSAMGEKSPIIGILKKIRQVFA